MVSSLPILRYTSSLEECKRQLRVMYRNVPWSSGDQIKSDYPDENLEAK